MEGPRLVARFSAKLAAMYGTMSASDFGLTSVASAGAGDAWFGACRQILH